MHQCLNDQAVKISSCQHHVLFYFFHRREDVGLETQPAANSQCCPIAEIPGVLHHLKAL